MRICDYVKDLSADGAQTVRDEIIATGGKAQAFTANVADHHAVADAAVQVGRVDVVINNAGTVTGAASAAGDEFTVG